MSQPACSQCSAPLTQHALQTGGSLRCPACQAQLELEVFPALHRPQTRGGTAERILVEGEAGCFYHPEKRAVIPCDACGRFLCTLCDLEFNNQHFCPNCLQARQNQEQMPELVNRRLLYDSSALLLTLLMTLFFCVWFLWIVSAPVAIFLAVLSWKKPGSILHSNRWRAVLAIVLALIQLVIWGVVVTRFAGEILGGLGV